MKKIFYFSHCFAMGTAQSQELNWYTDVKEAISLGNKEDKPLLLFSQEIGVASYPFAVLLHQVCKMGCCECYSCRVRLSSCAVSEIKTKQQITTSFRYQGFPILYKRIDKEAKCKF
jgi:hypothetical protein